MRGIIFKFQQTSNNVLYSLLRNIPFKKYDFYLCEEEFFGVMPFPDCRGKIDEIFFEKLQTCLPYYAFFLNLQAYAKGSNFQYIKSFDDFEKSFCQFIIFITDGTNFEIYSKEETLLLQFIKNAVELRADQIEIITNYNDSRTRFSVL